ncbi:MAG: DUF1552 domain-containing protein [Planctomycetaceae bacterium]|nr:DUF1552 domain-containing protein [Planctomycetaceae bacterium]
MASSRRLLSRRTLLRGAGTLVALPYLEAMMPSSVLAAPLPKPPARMGMFYFGTGMNMRQFTPDDEGKNFKLTRILKPLEPHRGQFTVLSGTFLEKGGGHDGAYPFSTSIAKDQKQSISPDQIAAEALGQDTRYASLQMSVKRGTGFGEQALATIAWNRQGVPLAAENDPHVLFTRLFHPDTEQQRAQQATQFRRRKSVLDLVREDATRLQQQVGSADRDRLDQYFNSVRELEQQLARRVEWSTKSKPSPDPDGLRDFSKSMIPEGVPGFFYDTYAKLMYDLIALALQTDSTRVVTYVVRTELAGGVYPEFSVSKDYHALTHHGNDPQNLEELAKVDTIYMQHWAYFLGKLAAVKEGDATLLDRTVLGFSSGMGIGHSKDLLPTVISGGTGLGIEHQGHLKLADKTPLANVWHTMLDRVGAAPAGSFQDSTGPIQALIKA